MKTLFQAVALAMSLVLLCNNALAFKMGYAKLADPNHENITRDALMHKAYSLANWGNTSFSESALVEIQGANVSVDLNHFWEADFHFDDESFERSSANLRQWRAGIRMLLHGSAKDVHAARYLLGQALHLLQDFYAHSTWVELWLASNYALPHPAFGDALPFKDLGLVWNPGEKTVPACLDGNDGRLNNGLLTTGYYDVDMSYNPVNGDLIPNDELFNGQVEKYGWSTKHWNDYRQKYSDQTAADYSVLVGNPDWSTSQFLHAPAWPQDDRCVHGGDQGSGLNKDQAGRGDVFNHAYSQAKVATANYVAGLIEMLRVNDKGEPADDSICLLFGQDPSYCAAPAGSVQIASLELGSTSMGLGGKLAVRVVGSNLPRFLAVTITDGRCDQIGSGTADEMNFVCAPGGSPGLKKVEVRAVDSPKAPLLKSAEVNAEVGVINVSATVALVLQKISLGASDVWAKVQAIAWNFLGDVRTLVSRVTDGVAEAVTKAFDTSGLQWGSATFKDNSGNELAVKQFAVTVAAPVVTSVVSPSPVSTDALLTFVVRGSNLPAGLLFALDGCAKVDELDGGTTSEWRFTCTFPVGTAAGTKDGAVGVPGSVAGSPFAMVLKTFQVNVTTAPVLPKITSAIEITPATPVVGDTITFIARGESLLNTGWMFKFSGMDYCGKPGATPTLITPTELRYSCTATAPTNLLGTVAVTSSDLVSQHGSAVLVRVGCPTGSVLNTQTAQCQADAGGNLKLGLVGHWSFDTCDAKDSSPNALHGVVSGAPVCVTGKSGKALRFNGATDWITVPTSASFPSQAVTFSYWLHREGNAVIGNLQNYLSKEIAFQSYLMPNAALTAGLWLGTPGFWSEHGSSPSTLPTLTDWVHFAFTYDNATRTAKNYVNGVLVETTVNAYANAVVRQSPYPLYIGRNGSANVYWIKGLLDEVRVYDRVLSAADVLVLQQGTGSNAAGSSLLPPTGAHSAQCFIAGSGSGNVQSCVGADALALSGAGKQDGMILRNFNYAELPRAGGGNFARTECGSDGFTGLVWEGKTADGGARDGSKATFTDAGDGRASDAAAYVAQVNSIALCGFTDWRVPNIAELQSIVHYGMGSGRPAIDPTWFPNSQGGYGTYYRSNTPYRIPFVDRDKFVLSLWDGAANWAFNERGHHLRLVRGGNSAVAGSRFVEQAGGSEVLDSATGLVWSRCDVGQTWAGNACVGAALLMTHEAALAHVKAIAGWRLPNIKELVSIVNFTSASPAVDIAVFPQTPQQPHWTSTAFVDGGSAWGVDFNSALFGPNGRFYAQPFRLVRAQ